MRVKFNKFDTHSDLKNIIEVERVDFKKVNDSGEYIVRVHFICPEVLFSSIGEIGNLFVEYDKDSITIFNNKAIMKSLDIREEYDSFNTICTRHIYGFSLV